LKFKYSSLNTINHYYSIQLTVIKTYINLYIYNSSKALCCTQFYLK